MKAWDCLSNLSSTFILHILCDRFFRLIFFFSFFMLSLRCLVSTILSVCVCFFYRTIVDDVFCMRLHVNKWFDISFVSLMRCQHTHSEHENEQQWKIDRESKSHEKKMDSKNLKIVHNMCFSNTRPEKFCSDHSLMITMAKYPWRIFHLNGYFVSIYVCVCECLLSLRNGHRKIPIFFLLFLI